MNNVVIDGNIVKSESAKTFHFFQGDGTKKSLCFFNIRNRKPYAKKDENGYYPCLFIPCKAFGKTAEFLNNTVKDKDGLVLRGYMDMEDAYTTKDGKEYPQRLVFVAEAIDYSVSGPKESSSFSNSGSSAAAAATTFKSNKITTPISVMPF